jgi:hypothetical protein
VYGGEDPVHPVLGAISVFFGALAGCVLGFCAFLLATAFPAMMRVALPLMSDAVFIGLWAVCVALPVYAFSGVYRNGKGLGARAYAVCGIAVLTVLFAGELTGAIKLYPWQVRFYVTPGPYERPVTR